MQISLDDLKTLLNYATGSSYTELRFHARSQIEIRIAKGELEEAKTLSYDGVGIRTLVDGAWGFSSTNQLTPAELRKTLTDAITIARVSSTAKKEKVAKLAEARLMKGRFAPIITDPLTNHSLEEKIQLVKETRHGYLVKGPRNGQADSNGEFMFGAQEAYRIENGEIQELLRGVSLSGRAFDVLMTVDAVARDFTYDLGAGFCGKWQYMRVDGGGAHLRCQAIIGGLQ